MMLTGGDRTYMKQMNITSDKEQMFLQHKADLFLWKGYLKTLTLKFQTQGKKKVIFLYTAVIVCLSCLDKFQKRCMLREEFFFWKDCNTIFTTVVTKK